MRLLVIDDDERMLGAIERSLRGAESVIFVTCFSVEAALGAITEHMPERFFLDHELSTGGSEGFEIVRRLQASGFSGVIYSITSRTELREQYEQLGVVHVNKIHVGRVIREILAQ